MKRIQLSQILYTAFATISLAVRASSQALNSIASVTQQDKSTLVVPYSYSLNWAGAVLYVPDGKEFALVTGRFKVVPPTVPKNKTSGTWSFTTWVGIDGAKNDVILRTGIISSVKYGQDPIYSAWYQWFPNSGIQFYDNLHIETGDEMLITIQAMSSTTGFAYVENISKGTNTSMDITSDTPLQFQSAEWIVGVHEQGADGFADFDSILFTGCNSFTNPSNVFLGESVDLSNASLSYLNTSSNGFVTALMDPPNSSITISNSS